MRRVLVVDDNELLSRVTCEILNLEGIEAVPAFNAEQALRLFEDCGFDLVVTDLRMAGMNGLELARTLRQVRPSLPVILITGFDPVEDDEILVCLQKSELFPALLEQVRICLAPDEVAAH